MGAGATEAMADHFTLAGDGMRLQRCALGEATNGSKDSPAACSNRQSPALYADADGFGARGGAEFSQN